MRKLQAIFILLVASGVILYASRRPILTSLGSYLVSTDAPVNSEVVVILGGDGYGSRIMKGCELVRNGVAKKAWVSGALAMYGSTEAKLAIQFAGTQGCPVEHFEAVKGNPDSTRDEAIIISKALRELGLHEFLLVTSNYHTRRAGKIFREIAPDLQVRVIPSNDPFFTPETWWESRQGRKTFFFEWVKTITERLGW